MKNIEVINAIKLISNYDVVGEEFPHKELDLAVVNCDYYVRPGINRKMFMFWFDNIQAGRFNYNLLDPNIPEDYRIPMILIGLVRTFFDKTYFEEKIKIPTEKIDNIRLKKCIQKLNKTDLLNFFILLLTGRHSRDLFISNSNSVNMWIRFNEECRKIDATIPVITEKSSGYSNLTGNNPAYFFNFLSTKQIANIICDSIDNHGNDAEKLAKILYNSGYTAAKSYLDHLVIS